MFCRKNNDRSAWDRSKKRTPHLKFAVCSLIHRLGYHLRFRGRDLAGKLDIVFRRRREVIFLTAVFGIGMQAVTKQVVWRFPKSLLLLSVLHPL
jgi:G:T-mismatch repair DNA endonuclease (very short patch repair protein)